VEPLLQTTMEKIHQGRLEKQTGELEPVRPVRLSDDAVLNSDTGRRIRVSVWAPRCSAALPGFALLCALPGKGEVVRTGGLIREAAEEELLLWLQSCVLCANSELLLKYRGEGYFYPIVLINISVADFSTKTNNKKNYS